MLLFIRSSLFLLLKKVKADLVVVADGCFSKFRKDLLVSSSVNVTSNFVGLVLHDVPQYAKGHAEIILGKGGPILIYQISSTCTRALIDVPKKLPQDMKKHLETVVCPQLPGIPLLIINNFNLTMQDCIDYMREPFLKAVDEGIIRSMPNSFLPSFPCLKPGEFKIIDTPQIIKVSHCTAHVP